MPYFGVILNMWLRSAKRTKESDPSDETLLEDWRRGDRQALGALFERHAETVYGACLFYFRNRELARDAVMHIFEKLADTLRQHDVRTFRPWLSAVTRNHCIGELRKSKPGRIMPETYLDFELREADPAEEVRIAGVSEKELLDHLEASLPSLEEKQRNCVDAFYLQGLSYTEIAQKFSYATAAVKSYIQNGKRNLKILISRRMNNG
jgi:RNA polymerase sigma factor (sigma-70 family)